MLPALSAVLDRLDAAVERAAVGRYWTAIATVSAYTAAINGAWDVPTHQTRHLAQTFFTPGARTGAYFERDLLLPLLANTLHATSEGVFETLCLGILIGGLIWLARGLKHLVAPATAFLLFAVIVSHPVVTVLLSWLGMPDVFTFAACVVALLTASPAVLAITASVAIVNHPHAMFALPMITGLRWLAGDRTGGAHLAALALGLAAGMATVVLLMAYWGIAPDSRISYVVNVGLDGWIAQNASVAPIAIWSMHGGVWPAVFVAAVAMWPTRPRYVMGFVAVAILSCALAFFSHDTTRILSLLTWAPAAHLVLTFSRDGRAPLNRVLLVLTLLALASPRLYVWEGRVVPSPFGRALQLMRR